MSLEAARQACAGRGVFLLEIPQKEISADTGEVISHFTRQGFSLAGAIVEILRLVGANRAEKTQDGKTQDARPAGEVAL